MKLTLGKTFAEKLNQRIERFEFEVGVLDDKPHKPAIDTPLFGDASLGSYAGGPVRKINRKGQPQMSIGQVFIQNQQRLGIDMLREPLNKEGSDILRFTQAFLKLAVSGKASVKRVENLLQAVIRNPILRGDYGPNRASTADAKGFDRHLIDTAQMFKALKARVRRRV